MQGNQTRTLDRGGERYGYRKTVVLIAFLSLIKTTNLAQRPFHLVLKYY